MSAADREVVLAVLGAEHPHVLAMVALLVGAGARLGWIHGEGVLAGGLRERFPEARPAEDPAAALEDPAVTLVVCAARPDRRAALACAALRAGKDVLTDKPGATRLEDLAGIEAAHAESGRRWAVFFSERLTDPASRLAERLVAEGAIGRVLHTLGVGPHRLGHVPRPDWFWDPARSGGILADLAAHQVDQFLHYTGATEAEVVAAQVANHGHPEHPGFEDFGELLLRGAHASGYARVDWYTPDGLETWGDVRLTLLGTEGTLELRKNCDPAGRPGGGHVILVDRAGARHLDARGEGVDYGARVLAELRGEGAGALDTAHALRATRLALEAQARATRMATTSPHGERGAPPCR